MICGHGHEQKFRYPYPRDSKKIQMPYPRAKAIDQNPALCPASPARRLDIDRCITWTCRADLAVREDGSEVESPIVPCEVLLVWNYSTSMQGWFSAAKSEGIKSIILVSCLVYSSKFK